MKNTILLSACFILGSLLSFNAQTELNEKPQTEKEITKPVPAKLNHNTTRASKGRVMKKDTTNKVMVKRAIEKKDPEQNKVKPESVAKKNED